MPRKISIQPEIGVDIARAFAISNESKKAVVARYTNPPWDWSVSKVYAVAKEFGWESGREERPDKGEIRIEGIDEKVLLQAIEVLLKTTRMKRRKRLMSTQDLIQQMVLNGYEMMRDVSVSTLNRWLRQRGITHEQLMAGNPAVEMASKHANHIHFADASICVQWDLRNNKKMIERDMQKSFYKNKPGYWKQVKKVLIRWLLVDHTTGLFFVDYSYAAGENTVDLLNFILTAWGPKEYSAKYPFHGVPFMLGLDPGAANKSHEVKNLTRKLGVELYVHAPGNSRASGAVETMHSYWEEHFESLLLLKLADSLEDLRERAHDRMIFLNAMRTHSRHGKSRSSKWMEITEEQLRILPPVEHCQKLATSAPDTRVPNEKLQIQVDNRWFKLKAPALKQVKVNFDYTPWDPDILNVWTDAGEFVPCRLIRRDENGFDVEAPVFGEGQYKRHADTPAQRIRNDFENRDKATRMNGFEPKPTAHLVPEITFLPRKGVQIIPTELPKMPLIRASEVPSKLRRDLSLDRINPIMRQQLEQWLGPREELTSEEYELVRSKARLAWLKEIVPVRSTSVFNGAVND
jgi:hypothetical protein